MQGAVQKKSEKPHSNEVEEKKAKEEQPSSLSGGETGVKTSTQLDTEFKKDT